MKMKGVFDLPVFAKMHGVGDRCTMFEGKGVTVASSFYANRLHAYDAMCHAINNHDKLTEENARLREALTGCSNELEFYIKKENAMIRRANDGDDSYSINSHYLAQAKHLLKGDEDE